MSPEQAWPAEFVAYQLTSEGPTLIFRERLNPHRYVSVVLDVSSTRALIELLSGEPMPERPLDWA